MILAGAGAVVLAAASSNVAATRPVEDALRAWNVCVLLRVKHYAKTSSESADIIARASVAKCQPYLSEYEDAVIEWWPDISPKSRRELVDGAERAAREYALSYVLELRDPTK